MVTSLDIPIENLTLADGEGHWITVNGTHVLIKDGGGPEHEQVSSFLFGKAHEASRHADNTKSPRDHVKASLAHADAIAAHERSKSAIEASGKHSAKDLKALDEHNKAIKDHKAAKLKHDKESVSSLQKGSQTSKKFTTSTLIKGNAKADNSFNARVANVAKINGISLEEAKAHVAKIDKEIDAKKGGNNTKVTTKSNLANQASEEANASGKPEDHAVAATKHEAAANEAAKAGDKSKEDEHTILAEHHLERAGGGDKEKQSLGKRLADAKNSKPDEAEILKKSIDATDKSAEAYKTTSKLNNKSFKKGTGAGLEKEHGKAVDQHVDAANALVEAAKSQHELGDHEQGEKHLKDAEDHIKEAERHGKLAGESGDGGKEKEGEPAEPDEKPESKSLAERLAEVRDGIEGVREAFHTTTGLEGEGGGHERHEPKEQPRQPMGRGGAGMSKKKTTQGKIVKNAKQEVKQIGLSLSAMEVVEQDYFIPVLDRDNWLELASDTTADGKPRKKFKKELIYEGQFYKDAAGLQFEVTPETLSHWDATFDKMTKNGVQVYIPAGHTNKPEMNRGYVRDMLVEPSTHDPKKLGLYSVMEMIGHDAIDLVGRTDVSLYSPGRLKDGKGNIYERPIVHVACCTDPVIPGLGEWEAMACSLTPYDPNTDDRIDADELYDYFQTVNPGDTVEGKLKKWGNQDLRTPDELHYYGVVQKVTNHTDQWNPNSGSYKSCTIVYKEPSGDLCDVSSCSAHTAFRKLGSTTLLSRDPLELADDKNCKGCGKKLTDDNTSDDDEHYCEDCGDEDNKLSLSGDKCDYAYCPGNNESDWKLPIHDAAHVSAAAAALSPGGFRGQKVDIPADKLAAVKAKVRSAWKKFYPDKDEDEMPDSLKLSSQQEGDEPVMNVATICNELSIDPTEITLDNAEELILSGILALKAEKDDALTLSHTTVTTKTVDPAVVRITRENGQLKLNNLVQAGRITPAVAKELFLCFRGNGLELSLANDGDDKFDKLIAILAENEPVQLGEKTRAQVLELSNANLANGNGSNLLLADANRRAEEATKQTERQRM